ncbi:uncharacterized protein [Glycine max]|uniref:uncharacterized protein n=1 Tax=Glycine max TaxID=3847 RepID=UPI0007193F8B|nr:uncharacterized protein LOC102668502 [Glycine max]|eukprot:XP_014628052.1 uncharacterized protein LOC102668502 [Glycine max]
MKSIGKDYDNIMEHESNRQLIPPSSPDKSNIVGAPRSNPRIGFEYQVEVPSMIKESKRLKLLMNTVDSELVHNEVEDNVANLNNSWSDADVSKSYSEGRISLEEYITSLKSTVALGVLVEAVGIGSCLGRLLARGWHSEKLKNQGSLSSKNFVAFLFPGVKKFSRRKLVKGDHCFDSVSDVLSKVVAEPNLLKLEVVETKVGGSNEEDAETGSNKDGQPDNHHHRYLKHRASTNNGDHMKSAIFYTDLVHRGKSSNLRELKSLPGNSVGKVEVDADDIAYNKGNKHISKTKHRKGKLDDISPSGTETAKIYSKKNSSNADCQKAKHNRDATGQKEVNANPDDANKMTENRENQKTCVPDGNQPKRIIENQFSQRARSGHSDVAVPPIKRQRLTAWAKAETSHILKNSSGGLGSEKLGLSVILLSRCQQESRVCLDKGISCDKVDKYESQHSINFNAPQVPLKFEDGEMMAKAEKDEQGLKPNDTIPRRKSTRNRPLTVRALESFANEFLHAQRKQKRKDILILKDPFNACSRKARTKGLKNVA